MAARRPSSLGASPDAAEVMGPVASITSAISAERSPDLPFGIGFTRDKNDETGEEEDDEDMKGYVVNGWEMLKLHNNIGGKSDRNYKVLFDLKMHTEDLAQPALVLRGSGCVCVCDQGLSFASRVGRRRRRCVAVSTRCSSVFWLWRCGQVDLDTARMVEDAHERRETAVGGLLSITGISKSESPAVGRTARACGCKA